MKKNLLATLSLLAFYHNSFAADFFIMDKPLPEEVKTIAHVLQLPDNTHSYDTELGVTSKCYKAKDFLILSENNLGTGYEITN